MAADWVGGFAKKHCLRFGWDRDEDLARVLDWRPEFERRHVTAEEADAASRRLLLDPPRQRADHLSQLLKVISDLRVEARPAGYEVREGPCPLCDGSGFVNVPHTKDFDKEGTWRMRYTMVVACNCAEGMKVREREVLPPEGHGKRGRHLTLETYEARHVPDWREWLAEKRAKLDARLTAENLAEVKRRMGVRGRES